jgi:glycosyltransferase involved in cell wall biosynthesis
MDIHGQLSMDIHGPRGRREDLVRISYFSPLPPDTSGIADYSALLLPALERLLDVEIVRPGRTRPLHGADVALYHVGNNPEAHGWIVDALHRQPGVVVLHDFVLHHLVAGLTIGRKDGHAYLAAMEREAGVPGRLLGYGVLEGRVPPLWEVRPEEFPLAGVVLDRATGLIVHSRYVETRAREHGYDGPLWRIPHPAWPAPDVVPAPVEGAPLVGCFGHLNESKRIPQLLRAFASLRESRPGARLLLVGSEAPGFDLAGRLERVGIPADGVIRKPYVEEARLWSLLAACDACVLLRAPTMGETSGSAIRSLGLGKPLVVSDVGWFAELPDEVALKVPPGGDEEIDALAAALDRLADPAVAAEMGAAARRYVAAEHDLERVAELYAAALEEAAGAAIVRERVLRELAEAAEDVGIEPEPLATVLEQGGVLSPDRRVSAGHAPVSDPWTWPARAWPFGTPPVWVLLGSLYATAAVVLLSLGLRVSSPWIMVDELVYSDMARSFAATGHFLIRGVHGNYGPLYPLLLSPVYAAFGPVSDAYAWARVVNALLIASAVFPAYLLARHVVRRPAALTAAALAVAVPSTAYAGTLMTENAFYPLFLWLALTLVLALERPTVSRQLVLLALCVVAFEVRAQTVALVVAALTAPLVLAWIERGRPRRLVAWAPLYAATAAVALLIVVVEVARGRSPLAVLGNYSVTSSGGYRPWPVVHWLVLHVAELDLYLWVLPFAALIVLAANARHLDAPLRRYVAAAATLSAWLVLEVAVFASRYSLRIEERNLFYLAPLFVIALLAWIERGQPRPSRASVVAAGLAAALPGTIPFLGLLNITAQSDTLGLQPWWYLGDAWAGRSSVSVVAVLVSIVLGAAFLWLPRRYAPVLPVVVALGFLLTWLPLELWTRSFPRLASSAYSQGVGPNHRSWIDRAVGRDAHVAVIWAGGNDLSVWENEFWNRSVDRVYDLTTPLDTSMPSTRVAVEQATGILRGTAGETIDERYVLAPKAVSILGRPVARDSTKGLVLYRVAPPARITTTITGLYPEPVSPWSNSHPVWTRYQCTGGGLSVVLSSDSRLFHGVVQTVRVTGTTPPRTVPIPSTTSGKKLTFPLTPQNGVCRVAFQISPVRRPSDYPQLHRNDSRLLGLHFDSIRYRATR